MKKWVSLALCVALAAVIVGCVGKTKEDSDEHEYPQIVYIDNVLYYGTGEECMQVPRMAPEGIIETFCSPEIMPDAPFSANFGEEYKQMEYMHLEDGQLIVHVGEKWFYFSRENN